MKIQCDIIPLKAKMLLCIVMGRDYFPYRSPGTRYAALPL